MEWPVNAPRIVLDGVSLTPQQGDLVRACLQSAVLVLSRDIAGSGTSPFHDCQRKEITTLLNIMTNACARRKDQDERWGEPVKVEDGVLK